VCVVCVLCVCYVCFSDTSEISGSGDSAGVALIGVGALSTAALSSVLKQIDQCLNKIQAMSGFALVSERTKYSNAFTRIQLQLFRQVKAYLSTALTNLGMQCVYILYVYSASVYVYVYILYVGMYFLCV